MATGTGLFIALGVPYLDCAVTNRWLMWLPFDCLRTVHPTYHAWKSSSDSFFFSLYPPLTSIFIILKNVWVLHNTVEHNYISPSSTLGLQLHVSALYVGHLQVVTWLSEQLYKMCGVFFWGIGGWVEETRCHCFTSEYHGTVVLTSVTTRSRSPQPNPQYPKRTPHTSCTAALKVKSQPEDGPHIGLKHVVVFLVYW